MRLTGSRPVRLQMTRWSRWLTVALAFASALAVVATPARPVAAGDDVCPEPNNAFQQACYLGTASDALGFIANPDDSDVYRIESLDFGAKLEATLPDMPHAYRLHLLDWRGEVIEKSQEGGAPTISKTLGPPGSYYLFVDSVTG